MSSASHGKYSPPRRPPHALNRHETARSSPESLTTNDGPVSRTHASLVDISTTRTCSGSRSRALRYCAAETRTVTGSASAIASATRANARWAGLAPRRQLSGRSGQTR